jgi:hypothetical protein
MQGSYSMNKTKKVQFTKNMTVAEIEAMGGSVIVCDIQDESAMRTGARYLNRGLLAEIWMPSNFSFDWDWQSCHFGTSASDYIEMDNFIICEGGDLKIIALPAEMNEMVDGIEDEEELRQFLSDYFGEEIELWFCGYGRQNKGRAPIEAKIRIEYVKRHNSK